MTHIIGGRFRRTKITHWKALGKLMSVGNDDTVYMGRHC